MNYGEAHDLKDPRSSLGRMMLPLIVLGALAIMLLGAVPALAADVPPPKPTIETLQKQVIDLKTELTAKQTESDIYRQDFINTSDQLVRAGVTINSLVQQLQAKSVPVAPSPH